MIKCIALIGILLGVASGAMAAHLTVAGLVGTWQLMSRFDHDGAGKVVPGISLGPDPYGVLIYDNAGHVSSQLSARQRGIEACAATAPGSTNNSAPICGYDAYFGRYEVDVAAGVVTHFMDGALAPTDVGRRVSRRFHLVDDMLTIEFEPGAPGITRTLVWRRISE
jgi:hypothetical protein